MLFLVLWACGPAEQAPSTSTPAGARALLTQGVAHAEIEQWTEALGAFQQAGDGGLAAFNVAVAHYRLGDLEAAGQWQERALGGAPPALAARVQLLRAKLAYEAGDSVQELAAHREAVRLMPEEAAYVHALSELYLRLPETPEDHGELLLRAYELWPENARLASAFSLWALAQPQREVRTRGLAVLEGLAAAAGGEVAAYAEKGRAELLGQETAGRIPTPLRIAFNLLRATKRFASDAAELERRAQVVPLAGAAEDAGTRAEAAPEVRLEAAELVPAPPLAAGESVLQAVLVDDAVEGGGYSPDVAREAAVALLSDQALYLLPRDGEWERLAEVPGAADLVAGDLDDDGRMELLALTAAGVRLWGRGEAETWSEQEPAPGLAAAGALAEALLVDFEHDGDLDLLALSAEGSPVLVTHRGEAGLGPPEPAPLPVAEPVQRLAAADIDGDSDQDLLLATAAELLVLRNWRQGEFALHARLPLPSPARQIVSLDWNGDGRVDLVALTAGGLAFWRGVDRARPERDPAAEEAAAGLVAHRAAVVDADLDGDLDLLLAGVAEGPGIVLLENLGGRFEPRPELLAAPWPAAAALLPLDLDGDRDADLLAWSGGELRSLRGRGAESQGWLALHLRAPNRKVPLDGRGVRVLVAAGEHTHHLDPGRPNVILGLGGDRPTLIKATWPNGISEYLFEPAAGTHHTMTLSLRVEGSCPFLYADSDDGPRFVTDILGLAPLGMLAGVGRYVPADPEEYLRLPDWVRERGGAVELRLTEELREVLYLDQVELVAVDAPAAVDVYNGERWLPTPVDGLALRLLSPLAAPVAVRDHRGREVLEVVRHQDHRYLTNHVGERRYQGAVAPHRLTVELPPAVAASARPALVLVGWLHWGNTSTNLARSQDPAGAPLFPVLEVPDGAGGWRATSVPVGLPAGKTKPVVVELTGALDPADPRLRITTDFEVYWDRVAVAALLPEAETAHRIHRLAPAAADLRFGGFSRWYRPAANGPYLFDYGERRAYPWRQDPSGGEVTLSWWELEGRYTAFGPVTEHLRAADDRLVVLGSGEEIVLRFATTALPPLPPGWRRTYFFHSEGWEKDGDPNVACSRTVEPLPYRGMEGYPCEGGTGPLAQRQDERTRWVAGDRLARRVEAVAPGVGFDD